MMMTTDYQHHFIKTNGITLHVVTAGSDDGLPVVLLHGFPEFWRGWHHQIPFLARQGYRVIVPDQRGYNLSDKPQKISAYHLDELMQDIIGLIHAFGYQTVYLAGHDWGGIVGWWLAENRPQILRKLAILNVPYPSIAVTQIREGNMAQRKKSRYVLAAQIPWLAERGFARQNVGEGRNILLRTAGKETFSENDLMLYEASWEKPGALSGMLNWYRANLRLFLSLKTPAVGSIKTPTLMLWGEKDLALGKELAQPSIELCADGRLIFFPEATHWLQHDEVEAVNQQFAQFFQ